MTSVLYQGIAFLRHWLRAGNAHGLHSPFVFELYNATRMAVEGKSKLWHERATLQKDIYEFWSNIEDERQRLLHTPTSIQIVDFGAGSQVSSDKERSIQAVAKSGLQSAAWGRRLAVLRQRLPAGPVLELGTSFGITTAYLATVSAAPIVTLEGCPATLAEASRVWHHLGVYKRVVPMVGNIDETLPEALAHGPFALIILDANHRLEAVLRYFDAVLPHLLPDGCIVIDDIYWTPEMTQAWETLKARPEVCQSIDFYRQGWLFFNDGQARQHFALRA